MNTSKYALPLDMQTVTMGILKQVLQEELGQEQQERERLARKIEYLESITPQYLTNQQACKALGISQPTLNKERDADGTLIKYHYVGKKPLYCARSIQEQRDAQAMKSLKPFRVAC